MAALLAFLLAGAAMPARAQWPGPTVNVPVCKATGSQNYRNAISDGAGGMFTAWTDTRFVLSDIYVQHVSASGAMLWHTEGVLTCGGANKQEQPILVSDGAGGVIVAWRDFRTDPAGDVYAQRVDSTGTPVWAFNGVPVCTVVGQQGMPVIATDTTGASPAGVVIAWEDYRDGPRIYAQRLEPEAGAPRWALDGVPVSSSSAAQYEPAIVPDFAGGALVAWSQQDPAGLDVLVQHVGPEGQAFFATDGLPVCTADGDQFHPLAVADSAGGAWIAWQDLRGPAFAVWAQRVSGLGFLTAPANGVAACTNGADQLAPALATDARGGIVLAWTDTRTRADVYAQRIDGSATLLWDPSGQPVYAGPGTHLFPAVTADGLGGALFAWEDDRTGAGTDIYAQRLDSLGVAVWAATGEGICTASGSQFQSAIVSGPDTVGIAMWVDLRGTNDLYCERVPLEVIPPPVAGRMLAAPNPASDRASLAFALDQPGRADLAIFDAMGRRVRTLSREAFDAGGHRIEWDTRDDAGRRLPGGVYFARLTVDGRSLATRSVTVQR